MPIHVYHSNANLWNWHYGILVQILQFNSFEDDMTLKTIPSPNTLAHSKYFSSL